MARDTISARDGAASSARTLDVEVVWGSVTETDGDVHVVGHYQGVLPQNAEKALDEAVSAVPDEPIIRDLTERGVIRGALGDLNFLPWGKDRMVGIAGMGVPGTFATPQLQKLVASVAATVGGLKGRPAITSVLVGSGTGNMGIAECIHGYLEGLRDAFTAYPTLAIERLRLVERNLERAVAMLRTIEEKAAGYTDGLRFAVNPELGRTPGGDIPVTFEFSMLLAAVAKESSADDTELRPWLRSLLEQIPLLPDQGKKVVANLRDRARGQSDLRRLALSFPIADAAPRNEQRRVPTRVMFSFDGRHVRTSAITETTTVTEREVPIRQELFDDLTLRLIRSNGFSRDEIESLGRFAFERLVHADMEDVFKPGQATIIELNRSMASLPFEMLVPTAQPGAPIALSGAIARQLRTSYSPPPIAASDRRIETALVIGDPGEGDEFGLPECRDEAREVSDLLRSAGIRTTLLVGSPRDVTGVRPEGSQAASMVAVQQLLFAGVDLVHYCGHGVYERDRPDLSGWVFGNGSILAADDLRQMRKAPMLVMANACVSALLSQRGGTRRSRRAPARSRAAAQAPPQSEAGLIAGLADEFFRQGVRDFIGAAFEVPDARARELAREFYGAVLGHGRPAVPLGDALQAARAKLYEAWAKKDAAARSQERNPSPIWGAYQHYGDPTRSFVKAGQ
jgi:hypothetical protein